VRAAGATRICTRYRIIPRRALGVIFERLGLFRHDSLTASGVPGSRRVEALWLVVQLSAAGASTPK